MLAGGAYTKECADARCSRTTAFALSLTPGVCLITLVLALAAALGGPIAVAIAAFVGVSALLINGVLSLLLVGIGRNRTKTAYVLLGIGLYVVSLILVVLLWDVLGSSQIM